LSRFFVSGLDLSCPCPCPPGQRKEDYGEMRKPNNKEGQQGNKQGKKSAER
jgi:hypothetical protein